MILAFRLGGPTASWGGHRPPGGNRPTGTYPTRSALIGFLAASVGIPNTASDALAELRSSVRVASVTHGAQRIRTEFRTARRVKSACGVASRDHALQAFSPDSWRTPLGQNFQSMLTGHREFLEDTMWRCFIEVRDADLAHALRERVNDPRFSVFLGRREHPLALHPDCQVLTADGLKNAMAEYPVLPSNDMDARRMERVIAKYDSKRGIEVVWELGFPGAPQDGHARILPFEPDCRVSWRFRSITVVTKRLWPERKEPLSEAELLEDFICDSGSHDAVFQTQSEEG